jgi:flagellar motor protein MotB
MACFKILLSSLCLLGSTLAMAAQPVSNLLSLGAGALVVQSPPAYDGWDAFWLLDEIPTSGWAQLKRGGVKQPFQFVFEMAGKAEISELGFSTARVDTENSEAREVLVEMGDSIKGPFTVVYKGSLKRRTDQQRVSVPAKTGRYLRLTILSNHGSTEFTQLMDFAAYGRFLAPIPVPQVSGSFDTDGDGKGAGGYALRLEQEGVTATGCFEVHNGLIENAGFEGRVLRLNWRQNFDDTTHGPAILIFPDDGQRFIGYRWKEGAVDGVPPYQWEGIRKSTVAGNCPHYTFKGKAGAGNALVKQLQKDGRVRLYGILFDTDSDVIKPESKPTIDALITAAKSNTAMKLLIEGHTDSTGGTAHNKTLSIRRAAAVKAALAIAGVNASLLATQGFGDDKPVASNDTALGRSQNRRVEIVLQ